MLKSSEILHVPFYFVRHGETDWNHEARAMGQTDIPINQRGVDQAHALKSRLAPLGITKIFHSPLIRAKRTAEIINEELNCELCPLDELKEFNIGDFAGQLLGDWFDDWRAGSFIPNGETYRQFIDRSLNGLNKALEPPGPVLIVAHGGVYWAVEEAIQASLNSRIPNAIPVFHRPPKTADDSWQISFI